MHDGLPAFHNLLSIEGDSHQQVLFPPASHGLHADGQSQAIIGGEGDGGQAAQVGREDVTRDLGGAGQVWPSSGGILRRDCRRDDGIDLFVDLPENADAACSQPLCLEIIAGAALMSLKARGKGG